MAHQSDGRPRHQQIAADLRARIMSGDLTPGSQLPSTQHLVALYNAANATIQRALTVLKKEGVLSSRAGKGVYVRANRPSIVDAAAYLSPTPGGYDYRLLEVAETRPPTEIAQALDLAEEGTTVLRRRLLLHDGSPAELSCSYYPSDIVARSPLTERRKLRGGAPQTLADLGYPLREFADRLSVRMPTTEEVEALQLPSDVPVIRQLRVIYSNNARPVEASILVKGGHLYELRYRQPVM